MTQETPHPRIDAEFNADIIAPSDRDWTTISCSVTLKDPRDRCFVIGDLGILYPNNPAIIATPEDWDYFFQRIDELNKSPTGFLASRPLIMGMAKVDREKAIKALTEGELDKIWIPALKQFLEGEQEDPDSSFYGSLQEFLILVAPKETQGIFAEHGQSAWDIEKKYVSWLRRDSPSDFFALLAALSEIDSKQTVSLLERTDFQLAREGLAYYRKEAEENEYRTRWLISHLAALKKLIPLFEELFQQQS